MYRGTTPTFTFTLPFECNQITALNVCFAQREDVVVEKDLSSCTIGKNTIQVSLTETETLQFDDRKGMVEMQLRIGCGESRMASNIMKVSVEQILKDGCLE